MEKTRLEIQKKVDYLLDKIASKKSIAINREDYPHVEISSDTVSYAPGLNYIKLRESDIDDGEVLGEDAIGHPLRRILRQQSLKDKLNKGKKSVFGKIKFALGIYMPENPDYEEDDPAVSEFFGYIGRRLLYDVAEPEDKLVFGKKRKKTKVPEDYKAVHTMGYKYAANIDLSKIQDLKSFFSLSDEEVKKRFFKPNPDYDPQQTENKNLENIVKFIIPGIILVIIMSVLSKPSMTGYSIIYQSNKQVLLTIITILSLLLIIFISYIVIRYKNKSQ
jgi:hypothetical protein